MTTPPSCLQDLASIIVAVFMLLVAWGRKPVFFASLEDVAPPRSPIADQLWSSLIVAFWIVFLLFSLYVYFEPFLLRRL